MISFIEATTLCDNADDNNTYFSNENTNIVINRLRHDFAIISENFYENHVVLNAVKCYFFTLSVLRVIPRFFIQQSIIENVTNSN